METESEVRKIYGDRLVDRLNGLYNLRGKEAESEVEKLSCEFGKKLSDDFNLGKFRSIFEKDRKVPHQEILEELNSAPAERMKLLIHNWQTLISHVAKPAMGIVGDKDHRAIILHGFAHHNMYMNLAFEESNHRSLWGLHP